MTDLHIAMACLVLMLVNLALTLAYYAIKARIDRQDGSHGI